MAITVTIIAMKKYSRGNPIPDNAERYIERGCLHHGLTTYALFTRTRTRKDGTSAKGYRCIKCNAANKMRHRKRIRQALIQELGGCCERCGYDKCTAALHFHHRDPTTKAFELSKISTNLERAREEVVKCMLVCANCHAEVHAALM